MKKIERNFLIFLFVSICIILALVFWLIFQKKEIEVPPPKEIVSPPKEITLEEILEQLTPREEKPLTKEEVKEMEKLLEQLTPSAPSLRQEELRTKEELLKKLTPQ